MISSNEPINSSRTPVVYETEIASAERMAHQFGRMGILEKESQKEIEIVRKDVRDLREQLGLYGIGLISTFEQPDNLGFEERRFIKIGKGRNVDVMSDETAAQLEDMDILDSISLWDSELDLSSITHAVVLTDKALNVAQGERKLLIDRDDQLKTLEKWRDQENERWSRLNEDLRIIPYVETPANVNSSYRVLATATGNIVTAGLIYRPRDYKQTVSQESTEDFSRWGNMKPLVDPTSKFYLRSREFRSNVALGGNIIPLITGDNSAKHNLSEAEQQVLDMHDISNRQIPADIARWSTQMSRWVGAQFGLHMGIDFIQDTSNRRYFLENNRGPGLQVLKREWGFYPTTPDIEVRRRLYGIIAQNLATLG